MTQPDYPTYLQELGASLVALQAALSAAVDQAVPIEGRSVRSCAMRLGLRRGMVHKVFQLAASVEPGVCLPAMLAARTWNTLIEALARQGVGEASLSRLRDAAAAASRLNSEDFAPRWMIELAAAGGLDSSEEARARLKQRASAFELSASMLGLSAELRLAQWFLAPSCAPGRIDVLSWTVFNGLRRTTPGEPWRLAPQMPPPVAGSEDRVGATPIVDAGELCPLVPDLSSPQASAGGLIPRFEQRAWGGPGGSIMLAPVLESRGRSFRAVFAKMEPSLGAVTSEREEDQPQIEVGANLPLASMVAELWVDRRIDFASEPVVGMFARSQRHRDSGWQSLDQRLPVEATFEEIELGVELAGGRGKGRPAALRKVANVYDAILERSCQLLPGEGPVADRFRCWRVIVPHPPEPSIMWVGIRMPIRSAKPTEGAPRRAPSRRGKS